jgi:hypothetical protein
MSHDCGIAPGSQDQVKRANCNIWILSASSSIHSSLALQTASSEVCLIDPWNGVSSNVKVVEHGVIAS